LAGNCSSERLFQRAFSYRITPTSRLKYLIVKAYVSSLFRNVLWLPKTSSGQLQLPRGQCNIVAGPSVCYSFKRALNSGEAARARNEGMSKLFDDGAYAHQRLNLGTKGKAHGRNTKASNRT
jgi:hypothetical protein